MNKKELTERDICTKFIVPALEQAGWDIQRQVREELYFTDGRIYVRGPFSTRGKAVVATLTGREIATKLKMRQSAIEKNLAKLQEAGAIQHEGSTKGSVWVVLDGDV